GYVRIREHSGMTSLIRAEPAALSATHREAAGRRGGQSKSSPERVSCECRRRDTETNQYETLTFRALRG
ncbi:MAG: hypothetical protein AAF950_16115, partial [Pseudomonadota bacterium]